MIKKFTAIASTALLVLTATGCSSTEGGASKDSVTIAVSAQPPALDPLLTTASITSETMRNVFETLMAPNADGDSVPMLADSVSQSEDGKTYTFDIRTGVMFHNGEELEADDVVASMNRWLDQSARAKQLLPDAVFDSSDDHTVTLTLKKRSSDTLDIMAGLGQFPAIMPKEIVDAADTTGVKEFIGTGPFEFVEWKQDQEISLKKFEDYAVDDDSTSGLSGAKKVRFTELHYKFVTDPSTRVSGLRSGEYDIAAEIPPDNYASLKEDPSIEVDASLFATLLAVYNENSGNTEDQKFRQAINAAIDSGKILAAAFPDPDLYKVNGGFMDPTADRWNSEEGTENFNQGDVELAKKLLGQSDYDGKAFRILTTRDYPYMYKAGVVIQQQLEQIGINVELEVYDWPTLTKKRGEKDGWDMFISHAGYVSTPSQLLALSDSYAGAAKNEHKDELVTAMRRASTYEEALDAWGTLQEYVWDYLPMTNLGHISEVLATSDKVEGLETYRGALPWTATVEQ